MTHRIYFENIYFEPDLISGRSLNGDIIKFSRHERALLSSFIKKPNRLLSRNHLLNAINREQAETIDRNVDYLISRLRKKLGDSPKNPKLIGTQYGEGYIWLAKPTSKENFSSKEKLFLLIGPAFGLQQLHKYKSYAQEAITQLATSLKKEFYTHQQVIEYLEKDNPADIEIESAHFSLEPSFLITEKKLHCAFTVRDNKQNKIIMANRFTISLTSPLSPSDPEISHIAHLIKKNIWDQLTGHNNDLHTARDQPLAFQLDDAAALFYPNYHGLKKIGALLRETVEKNPDDHYSKILLATHLHTCLLDEQHDIQNTCEEEREIESLILEALPHIKERPLLFLASAKLLYFIGRGHQEIAKRIASDVLNNETTHAASFAVNGQISLYEGHIEEGLKFLNLALDLTEKSSQFQLYLHVLKCTAFLALKKWDECLQEVALMMSSVPQDQFRRSDTSEKLSLALLLTVGDNREVAPQIKALVATLTPEKATAYLRRAHYSVIRLFKNEQHRANIFRGSMRLLTQRFGASIIPGTVRQSVPKLCIELTPEHTKNI